MGNNCTKFLAEAVIVQLSAQVWFNLFGANGKAEENLSGIYSF